MISPKMMRSSSGAVHLAYIIIYRLHPAVIGVEKRQAFDIRITLYIFAKAPPKPDRRVRH